VSSKTVNEGKPHRRLQVWQASVAFVVELYQEVKKFPDHERFGIVSQLQRAAVSIASNIAEGAARKNTKELLQFLHIASPLYSWYEDKSPQTVGSVLTTETQSSQS